MRAGPVLAVVMATAFALVAGAGYLLVESQRTTLGQAPGFALTSTGYEDGAFSEPVNFTLQDYRGKTVVLDFMAVTCATCRIVTEQVLRPLQDEFGSRPDFALLSVDVWASDAYGQAFGETRENLIALQQRENTTWRHALDTEGLIQKYGAVGIPLITVINGEGQIVYQSKLMPDRQTVTKAVEASLTGTARETKVFQASVPVLALLAGLAVILTPCSVGMLPGYIGEIGRAHV